MTQLTLKVRGDLPPLSAGAPAPCYRQVGAALWVAYFTRDDHCAVVRFDGVTSAAFGEYSGETLDQHPLFGAGLIPQRFHEVHDPAVAPGLKRWIITFRDDTLDVTGAQLEIVARALEVSSSEDALAMVMA
ncbi:MAG TPA: hypothetical protein VMG41_02385 [Gemmatimonadales bacterium]|nr:hypothetical protein [Gemmatimonadales bacterium]